MHQVILVNVLLFKKKIEKRFGCRFGNSFAAAAELATFRRRERGSGRKVQNRTEPTV